MSYREEIRYVYQALQERGYDPERQLVGFLLTGDPTYITNHNGARTIAGKLERTEVLAEILANYLGGQKTQHL